MKRPVVTLLLLHVAVALLAYLVLRDPFEPSVRTAREAENMEARFAVLNDSNEQGMVILVGDSLTNRNVQAPTTACGLSVINLGVSSATTADLLNNKAMFTKTRARYAFVMIGINDIRFGAGEGQLEDNYWNLLNFLKDSGITPILQSPLPVTGAYTDHEQINDRVDQLTRWAKETALDLDLRYIDVRHAVPLNAYTKDGLHIADYSVWNAILNRELQKLCTENQSAEL